MTMTPNRPRRLLPTIAVNDVTRYSQVRVLPLRLILRHATPCLTVVCCLCALCYVIQLVSGAAHTTFSSVSFASSRCEFPEFVQTNGSTSWGGAGGSSPLLVSRPPRQWRGRVRDQFTTFSQRVTFDGSRMIVADVDDNMSDSSFNRQCLVALPDNKFLVRQKLLRDTVSHSVDVHEHHDEDNDDKLQFICVQIIRRSDSVVQLRYSSLSTRLDRSLCSDSSLKPDPWLVIDAASPEVTSDDDEDVDMEKVRKGNSRRRTRCSLRGGFSIRIFERARQQGVCDGYRGETRFESECVRGQSGLYFYFRHRTCIPDGLYMYSVQRTLCLASWTEEVGDGGTLGYILLRHDRLQYMWVLRYPLPLLEDSFTAYLYKDLIATADTAGGMPHHDDLMRLRLDTVRDTARPMTSLCVDEYEACTAWKEPCATGTQMALTCPRTCGVCNAGRPRACSFPGDLADDWLDLVGGKSTLSVTINRTSLTVRTSTSEDSKWEDETFHCVTWNVGGPSTNRSSTSSVSPRMSIEDVMLVTEYTDGCRPRYTCIRIQRRSPSLIGLQFSQSLTWPLGMTSSVDPIDCRWFSYDHDGTTSDGALRSTPARAFYSRNKRDPVPCRFPPDLANYTTVRWYKDRILDGSGWVAEDGGTGVWDVHGFNPFGLRRCTRTGLLTESEAQTSFILNTTECVHLMRDTTRKEDNNLNINQEFLCLKATRTLPSGDIIVITRTTGKTPSNDVIHCWIVFERAPRQIYWLDSSSGCNVTMITRRDSLAPIAIFSTAAVAATDYEYDAFEFGQVTTTTTTSEGWPPSARRWPETSDQKTYASDIQRGGGVGWSGYDDKRHAPMNASSDAVAVNSRTNFSLSPEAEMILPPSRNAFVVLATAVVFAVLQMPCLCW